MPLRIGSIYITPKYILTIFIILLCHMYINLYVMLILQVLVQKTDIQSFRVFLRKRGRESSSPYLSNCLFSFNLYTQGSTTSGGNNNIFIPTDYAAFFTSSNLLHSREIAFSRRFAGLNQKYLLIFRQISVAFF